MSRIAVHARMPTTDMLRLGADYSISHHLAPCMQTLSRTSQRCATLTVGVLWYCIPRDGRVLCE